MSIRVLINNHICLYAEGLRRLLADDKELQVTALVCEAGDPAIAGKPDADLIISDVAGFADWAGRGLKILLIWDTLQLLPPLEDLKEMIEQGLAGIIDAKLDPELLLKAVQRVHAGELWFDHKIIKNSLSSLAAGHEIHLSRRESDVLQQICDGCTNKEIADHLCISEQTVKTHCHHLYRKFGVSSRLQLALRVASSPTGAKLD